MIIFNLSAAIRIEQKLAIFNSLAVLSMSEFNLDTNIIVNIVSNIDFSSSPSKLCVKLTNKKFYLKYKQQM